MQSLAAEAEAALKRKDPVDMDLTGEVLEEIVQGHPTPFKRAIPGSVYIPRTSRTPKMTKRQAAIAALDSTCTTRPIHSEQREG